MDYEEKYKKLVDAIKVMRDVNPSDEGLQNWISDNVPELAESEDEKVRKRLIAMCQHYIECYALDQYNLDGYKEALAWLEKQGNKDKLIKELGEYKVKYTQEVLEKHLNSMNNKDNERLRKTTIAFLKEFADKGYENAVECIDWLEKQGEPVDKGEISDGFHTFNELYYYRMLYNAAFFNMLPKEWVHKSKKHNDGELCFGGGWFIVMANLPTGQISNHYELKDWELFQIPEKERADKWDGHTPQEAAERLHKFLLEKQGEPKSDVWTEQDKTILEGIICEIEANKNSAPSYDLPTYDKYLKWLESLKKKIITE